MILKGYPGVADRFMARTGNPMPDKQGGREFPTFSRKQGLFMIIEGACTLCIAFLVFYTGAIESETERERIELQF
jgi:hypothetical protein